MPDNIGAAGAGSHDWGVVVLNWNLVSMILSSMDPVEKMRLDSVLDNVPMFHFSAR